MKKLLSIILALILLSPCANANQKNRPFKSFFTKKNEQIQQNYSKIKDINDIKHTLCLLTKYSNEHNTQAILSLYDKDYKSFDGFSYDTFKKMLNETFEAYADISYKSDVRNITLYDGNRAVVTLVDVTNATLTSPKAKKAIAEMQSSQLSEGVLEGECNYALYLKKIDGSWKITGDNVIAETTSIKYGSARYIPMEFVAPIETKKGEDYCLTLDVNSPKGTKAIASLGREEILYPSSEPKEAFRKIPSDGILERVVRANGKGFNEYAIASIGFTKIDVLEDFSAIRFEMTGLAFLMQRVNIKSELNPVREVKEEKKDAEDKG